MEISRKLLHFREVSICHQGNQICRQVTKMVSKFVAKVRNPGLAAADHSILTPVKLSSQPQDKGVYSGTPGWVPHVNNGTQPNRGYQNRPLTLPGSDIPCS
ncbi:hypothetical protein AVEN_62042-1 [Araneus ventricosus]|uniref:Uncharacterized protein n=1 Tax=Araneus ventricosus TaxID=182803 RepID=A0A4Y2JFA7_ARAVE|nr:hypothetical protein AVEN_62042-1 [Araneus ventricosus]